MSIIANGQETAGEGVGLSARLGRHSRGVPAVDETRGGNREHHEDEDGAAVLVESVPGEAREGVVPGEGPQPQPADHPGPVDEDTRRVEGDCESRGNQTTWTEQTTVAEHRPSGNE